MRAPHPVRPSDASYFYVFAGWTPEIKVVTEDTEYTAVYNAYDLLKLVSSPASQTLPDGEEAVFTVVTFRGRGSRLCISGMSFLPASRAGMRLRAATAIPGATSDTLSVTSSAQVSGNRYYCVVPGPGRPEDCIGPRPCSRWNFPCRRQPATASRCGPHWRWQC